MHPETSPGPGADGPLPGGTANHGRVIRVGDTVRRPRGPYTEAVHALLGHLAAHGFDRVPRVLAVEPDTEIVGYIPGVAATEPVAEWALTPDVLTDLGRLLREFHRAAAGFDGGGRRWQRPVPSPWADGPDALVTHNDLNPANVVFRAGRPVAMIDFDLAAPGSAAFDLAVTACFWAPLRDAADIPDSRHGHVLERYRRLLDGYGADAPLRAAVTAATPAANRWIADVIEDNANRGHPTFGRLWESAMGVHARAATWLSDHAEDLRTASR
jgi:Ser/Thr protein kinase RdoA (MazF antagonist)